MSLASFKGVLSNTDAKENGISFDTVNINCGLGGNGLGKIQCTMTTLHWRN
jgi:hypothetical protein